MNDTAIASEDNASSASSGMDLVNALERDASFSVVGASDEDSSFSSDDDLEASTRRDHSSHTTLNHSLMNHSSSNHHHHHHNNGRRPSRVSSHHTSGTNDDPADSNYHTDDSVFSSDDEMGRSGATNNSEFTSASRHVAELRDDTKDVTDQIDRRRKLVPLLGLVAVGCLVVAVGTSAAALVQEKDRREEYPEEIKEDNNGVGDVDGEALWVRYLCI